ncbi:MAG: UDP-N-acetylmuramoyl-tripeptide--D-alanyl-D-alanine ligase [Legionellaceae bacterium]
MLDFTLSELAKKIPALHQGSDMKIHTLCTDTRYLQPGDVFLALQGLHFNGHDFIAEAEQKGAAAVIVSQEVTTVLPLLRVSDTRIALGKIAQLHRQTLNMDCVAITGSCGKTTTKTLMAAVLSQQGKTLATQGTLNNDIGVPLTLLRLNKEYEYAVIELGANHRGEIAYIAEMTVPNIAIITNAGPVHLEGFKTIEGVAKAKGEIYQFLTQEGIAIINADDPFANYWKSQIKSQAILTFGFHAAADITATNIRNSDGVSSHFDLVTPKGSIDIELRLIGEHNISNALAVAAAAIGLDIPLTVIKTGLESIVTIDKRLVQKPGLNGGLIIDDSYNANPFAFKIAIELLSKRKDEKILVMGDMGELGSEALNYHAEVGRMAKAAGIDHFFSVGPLSENAASAFGQTGKHYLNQEALIQALKPHLRKGVTVLVKGSRSAKMENVVAELIVQQEIG